MVQSRDGQASARPAGPTLVSRTCQLPDVSPVRVLRAVDRPLAVWLPPDEPSVVGCGEAAVVTADGPDRFATVRNEAARLFEAVDGPADAPRVARPRLLGGFAFHDAHEPRPPWTGFPAARFVLPRLQFVRRDGRTWVTVNGVDEDPSAVEAELADLRERFEPGPAAVGPAPGLVETERTTERDAWGEQVREVVGRIEDGRLEKAVLAQALSVSLGGPLALPDVLARMGERYPECYRFAVQPGEGAVFFGATPERLLAHRGDHVETGALASSVGRGDTREADEELARRLRESPKTDVEHELVADAIRDQLRGVADGVTTGERRVRTLANVQHLYTPISADLRRHHHVLDLVTSLHPTPAVGGLPPDAALRTIRETETFDRGWYAAPVGWFDAEGDGTFAVAIRSAVADGDGATLYAGNGIVADSDPDDEWDEVLLKYCPVLDALE